jgi:hypothetical protein
MFYYFNNIKYKLLYIAIDLNLKKISLYINNTITISYFYFIYYIKLIEFLFLVLWKLILIYYFKKDEISLYFAINKH